MMTFPTVGRLRNLVMPFSWLVGRGSGPRRAGAGPRASAGGRECGRAGRWRAAGSVAVAVADRTGWPRARRPTPAEEQAGAAGSGGPRGPRPGRDRAAGPRGRARGRDRGGGSSVALALRLPVGLGRSLLEHALDPCPRLGDRGAAG